MIAGLIFILAIICTIIYKTKQELKKILEQEKRMESLETMTSEETSEGVEDLDQIIVEV
jgi:hypothetical protein